jgi:hypothetical protein
MEKTKRILSHQGFRKKIKFAADAVNHETHCSFPNLRWSVTSSLPGTSSICHGHHFSNPLSRQEKKEGSV